MFIPSRYRDSNGHRDERDSLELLVPIARCLPDADDELQKSVEAILAIPDIDKQERWIQIVSSAHRINKSFCNFITKTLF